MKNKILYGFCLLCFLICIGSFQNVIAKRIHNKEYKFNIALPDQMVKITDSTNSIQGDLYYDTTAGIILMISARESKFKSVDDYLNCSKEELEKQLKLNYGDPTLNLISCNKSPYYPKKTTTLHFRVSVLPFGYNTYLIYFVHHRQKDIQISFTYKKENTQSSQKYIDSIMQTLKLK